MIDWNKTFKETGYNKEYFDKYPKSHRLIYRICDSCDEGKWIIKSNNKKGYLCKLCSQKLRQQLPKPKFVKEEDRFIKGTGIDRILTIEKYDYDPIYLCEGSGKKIMSVCQQCNKSRSMPRQYYRDICKSCANKNSSKLKTGKNNFQFNKPIPLNQRIKMSCSHQGISIEDFTGFTHNNPYCYKFNDSCKESNRNKYDRKCFICNKSEDQNGQKLSVHHVDMNKNQGCNNIDWKLIPVCQSCHRKLHNNLCQSRIEYLLFH